MLQRVLEMDVLNSTDPQYREPALLQSVACPADLQRP
jgi:hypothetical protein